MSGSGSGCHQLPYWTIEFSVWPPVVISSCSEAPHKDSRGTRGSEGTNAQWAGGALDTMSASLHGQVHCSKAIPTSLLRGTWSWSPILSWHFCGRWYRGKHHLARHLFMVQPVVFADFLEYLEIWTVLYRVGALWASTPAFRVGFLW